MEALPGTIKCFRKPRRSEPRLFTAKDCSRIVCRAIQQGVSEPEMVDELSNCLSLASEECQEERKQIEQVAEFALSLIQSNNVELKTIALIGSVVELAVKTLARVARFIPGAGRFASIPLETAARATRDAVVRVEARIAANDAQFAIINRIAANNAQFLLRSVGR